MFYPSNFSFIQNNSWIFIKKTFFYDQFDEIEISNIFVPRYKQNMLKFKKGLDFKG
jgi:hypothetical protein